MAKRSLRRLLPLRAADIVNGAAALAAVALSALMTLTVADVLLRRFFRLGIPGIVETSEWLLVCIVFLALPQVERLDRQIRAGGGYTKGNRPSRPERWRQAGAAIIAGLTALSLAAYGLSLARAGEVSFDLGWPRSLFVFVAAGGMTLLASVHCGKIRQAGSHRPEDR